MKNRRGFTLIELMIVIAIIGVLIAVTFKLFGAATESKRRAVTTARLQRLENALSGYYSAYGAYPSVPFYENPDPYRNAEGNPRSISPDAVTAAARAQPVAFEFPTPQSMDEAIPLLFYPDNVISVNTAISSLDPQDSDWNKYKGFKFGLLSFLLPRVEIVGHPSRGMEAPLLEVYRKAQWRDNNLTSRLSGSSNADLKELETALSKQQEAEKTACRRWMPCFEKSLSSFAGNILGVDVRGGDKGGHHLAVRQMASGPRVALAFITIVDGWGHEFFYYSAPPYQSYRIWSAGADGFTFPPWIPSTDQAYIKVNAKELIKDDIVGGKIQ